MDLDETTFGMQDGQSSRWERLALAGGIIFGVLQLAALVFFITVIFSQKPAVGAPVIEQAAYYAQHGDTLALGNYLLVLPAPFFFLFLGGLFGILRRAEGGSGTLSISALGAGIALALIWPLGCIITNIGVTIAREGGDAATVWAIDALAPYSLALSALPRALLAVVASLLLLQARRTSRPIGWLGLAAAILSVLGSGTLVVGSLFPLLSLGSLLFEVWVVVLSVALLRRPRPAQQRASQPALA